MNLIDPTPGGLEWSDDIWMVDIPGVDKYLDIIQDLNFYDSIAAINLQIKVSVYKDTEGA